jgi:hypothetical protein
MSLFYFTVNSRIKHRIFEKLEDIGMARLHSRAGRLDREMRLNHLFQVARELHNQDPTYWWTIADIARQVGMRPSHHLRGLVHALVAEGSVIVRGGVGRGCIPIRREYQFDYEWARPF